MKKIISLLLCFTLLFSMAACGAEPVATTVPPTTTTPPTTVPAVTAQALYDGAVASLNAANNLTLDFTLHQTMVLGPDTITLDTDQDLILTNLVSGDFQGRYSDKANFGSGAIIISGEIFSDGTLYCDLRSEKYQYPSTREDFLASHLPALLLDISLYESAELLDDGTIALSGATAPESWLNMGDAQLTEASGTVSFTDSGEFAGFTYYAAYTRSGISFTLEVTSKISTATAVVVLPSDTESYRVEENGRYLKTMEYASGYLLLANALTAGISEQIVSQAAGAVLTQQTTLDTHGSGKDLMAKVGYNIQITDYVNSTEDRYEQEEVFLQGAYTVSTDGSAPVSQSGVTSDLMWAYCLGLISENMPATADIWDLQVTDLNGVWLLEYEFTEEIAQSFNEYCQGNLLTSPTFLEDLPSTTGYRTETANGYMGIDQLTGLPTAMGITYTGYHTIDGMEYALTLETNTSLYAGSMTAHQEITDETLLTGQELPDPTPLFYHVTGPDGEEMWLMGTIHVGDGRITNLPQEIWDALEASDALAVEVDTDAFEQQIEEDQELALQLSEAYFYTDGSMTEDHLKDADLYANALKLMKATGSYNQNVPYMKPSLWAQSIENFYLRQGYNLISEFGVDNQLMTRARENGTAIISIESGLAQMQMFGGYSDALQEMLLADALESGQWAYIDSTQELFEMWCAGDEAALIEYLQGDLTEVTEEEAALYDEYNKALSTDRNIAMLDAAKGFLSSGNVIFYAVGLAHLLAEDGLVFTLRDAGYTVELVTFK